MPIAHAAPSQGSICRARDAGDTSRGADTRAVVASCRRCRAPRTEAAPRSGRASARARGGAARAQMHVMVAMLRPRARSERRGVPQPKGARLGWCLRGPRRVSVDSRARSSRHGRSRVPAALCGAAVRCQRAYHAQRADSLALDAATARPPTARPRLGRFWKTQEVAACPTAWPTPPPPTSETATSRCDRRSDAERAEQSRASCNV